MYDNPMKDTSDYNNNNAKLIISYKIKNIILSCSKANCPYHTDFP